MVTLVHGNELLSALATTSEGDRLSRALLYCDRIVAVSRFSAGLAERIGVPPNRISVVHPGCDAETFIPKRAEPELLSRVLGARSQDRVILTIGSLVARKGHDMVIRALPMVLRAIPDTTYLIVGDGPCRRDLEAQARELGVAERVVFAGQVCDAELPDYYALSDVFIMASREQVEDCTVEGFGIVYLEANACGKPVIGGRSGGVPDAVQDGETGLLVDPRSPEKIARALISLLSDRTRAARMGRVGRARVVQEFSWSRMAEQVYHVLCSSQGAVSSNNLPEAIATINRAPSGLRFRPRPVPEPAGCGPQEYPGDSP
jgi:phosphatidylinositol alpha-1,6-mannosyltransferase